MIQADLARYLPPASLRWLTRVVPRRTGLPLSVILITLMAWVARVAGLPTMQGTMGRDESRLVLAAWGILDHGIPLLPGGFVYTRGLLPTYLEAASIALLGGSDQAARLPNMIFATLLVPAVYQLGRHLSGHRAGLAAAAIVALSPPLVLQGREAWLYSALLFWMTASLAWLVRDGPGDRVRAGLAAVAALLSHELAILLVPVAALLDMLRVWRGSRSGVTSVQALLPFWGVVLIGAIGVGTLSVLLRTPTLGGATSEIREFLRPGLDLRGLQTSLRILGGWHPLLLPVTLLAVPISRAGWRSLLTGSNVAPALLMLLAVIAFNSFGLVRRGEARYLLPALPFLSIVAAAAADRVGTYLGGALSRRSTAVNWQTAVPIALLLTLVVTSLDPGRLRADAETRTVNTTWVQAMAERAPDDLIVSFAPTLTSRYLGRTDIWLRTEGYAKYVWKGRPPYRDVHTGAIVVRNESELERLLVRPNRGRTAWVLLAGEPSAESDRTMRELAKELVALATTTRRTEDGRVVLRIRL